MRLDATDWMIWVGVVVCAAVGAAETNDVPYKDLPGDALVKLLVSQESAERAYHELRRRSSKDDGSWERGTSGDFTLYEAVVEASYEAFIGHLFNQVEAVFVCPQNDKDRPLYAVVNRWDGQGQSKTRIDGSPMRLLGPVSFWDSAGARVYPYGEPPMDHPYTRVPIDMLDGYLGDLNGDGRIERVQRLHYESFVGELDVLEVSVIATHPALEFAAVYSAGDPVDWVWYDGSNDDRRVWDEMWGFDIEALNGKQAAEICFGPVQAGGIQHDVVMAWDGDRGRYVPRDGKDHKRCRVIYEDELRQSKGEIQFGSDTIALNLPTVEIESKFSQTPQMPQPYRWKSHKGLSNEAILDRPTGSKPYVIDLGWPICLPMQVPVGFWTMPVDEAAVRYAKMHPGIRHRRDYTLEADTSDANALPTVCNLHYEHAVAGHAGGTTLNIQIHCEPSRSYLVSTSTSYLTYNDYSPCSIGYMEIPHAKARRIVEIALHLKRINAVRKLGKDDLFDRNEWSRGYGAYPSGSVTIIGGNGERIVDEEGSDCYTDHMAGHWTMGYDATAFVNLVGYLLEEELPPYMAGTYEDFGAHIGCLIRGEDTQQDAEKLKLLTDNMHKILRLYRPDARDVGIAIVTTVVEKAGLVPDETLEADLKWLLGRIPAVDPKLIASAKDKHRQWDEYYDRRMEEMDIEIEPPNVPVAARHDSEGTDAADANALEWSPGDLQWEPLDVNERAAEWKSFNEASKKGMDPNTVLKLEEFGDLSMAPHGPADTKPQYNPDDEPKQWIDPTRAWELTQAEEDAEAIERLRAETQWSLDMMAMAKDPNRQAEWTISQGSFTSGRHLSREQQVVFVALLEDKILASAMLIFLNARENRLSQGDDILSQD